MPNYRMKCRNDKCGGEFHRKYSSTEFDELQYGSIPGIGCFNCGFPKMVIMKSRATVNDGFQPGFQRNIRKYCETYGQYKRHLKDMGLVEVGYEDFPPSEDEKVQFWTDDVLKHLSQEHDINLSGNEAELMKNYHLTQ